MSQPVPSANCRRCGAGLRGAFCAECGQPRAEPVSLPYLWREGLRRLTELDGRVPATLRAMTLRPGWMVREYLEGNRASWVNPAKYLFFAATTYAVIVGLRVDPETMEGAVFGSAASARDLMLVIGMLAYLGFVFQLIVAAVMRGLYRGVFSTLGEAYVAALYVYGHVFVLASIPTLLGYWQRFLAMSLYALWLAFTLRGLCREAWWKTLYKLVLVFFTYFVSAVLTVIAFLNARYLLFGVVPG